MKKPNPANQTSRGFRYLDVIACLFVAVLIISNIASVKIAEVSGLIFDGGTILFPVAYVLGDVLTEVYGYSKARRVIWLGFGGLVLTSLTLWLVGILPAAHSWENQEAYQAVLGFLPRIAMASLVAYLLGSFINAFILAKLKIKTAGQHLWLRTISSSLVGQAFDTAAFSVVAFGGVISSHELLNLIVTVYVFKISIEVLATPLVYMAVSYLKKAEDYDALDAKIDFNPIPFSNKIQ